MSEQAIAIIGVSCRLPQARDTHTLWQNLLAGRVCSTRYSADRLRALGVSETLLNAEHFVPVDSRLDYADQFDPELFAISQREAELLDPQQRLLLECAWELAQLTGLGNPLHRPRIGVFAGSSMNSYLPNVIGGECDLVSPHGTELMLTNDKDYLCARISYKLGFQGPSVTVQTGCSSSLSAVHSAIQSLLLGECEVAFAGGVSVHAHPRPGYCYHPDLMFSRDGACRPFDEEASGTFFGDGAGLVALRPLEDALRNGDSIHAVILGSATNNDGAARAGFSAPGVDGQRQLILDALSIADVPPESLGMIEAHGTGTRLGDPIEFNALCQAFARHTDRRGFCALGSVKANLGHLAAAAGFAGLAKTILSLKNGRIAPHPSFRQANRALHLEQSPFLINTQPMDWPTKQLRRAGLSSFGAGGSNVHMIVQQAPVRSPRVAVSGWQAILLSARDAEGVEQVARELSAQLRAAPDTPLDEVACGFAEGRSEYPWRMAVQAADIAGLANELDTRHYEIRKTGSEPTRLLIDVGPQLFKAMAHEPAYRQEVERLIAQIPEASDVPATVHILQALMHPPVSHVIYSLATLAAFRCLRRWVRTPLTFLVTPDTRGAIECQEGRLSVVQLLVAGAHGDLAALGHLSEGYCLRDDVQVLPTEVVLSLEPGTHDQMATACPQTWRSAAQRGMRGVLGELWCEGVQIDWSSLRVSVPVPHRTLPIPPMRYRRCWYEPVPAQAPPVSLTPAMVYVEQWERLQRLSSASLPKSRHRFCMVGEQHQGLFDLSDALGSWGHVVTFETEGVDDSPEHLIWYLGDDSDDKNDPTFAWQLCERVKQWSARGHSGVAVTLVGSGFVDPFGEGAACSGRAAALACIAAINQELPGIAVNVLDTPMGGLRTPSQTRQLVMALMQDDPAPVLALRHGILWTRRYSPLSQPVSADRQGRRVCLVTGGLGSVGFGMAHYIARTFSADLVLVRRPGIIPAQREALYQERLAALRELGSRVEVIQADVCNRESLYAALAGVCGQGLQPDCFVHAAGMSGNSTLQWLNKTSGADWQRLMAPKWAGARHLHEWFSTRPLQFGCFVSSLAVLAGGLGLAPYAAANEACASWTAATSESRPYFAIDWDGWEGWEQSQSFKHGIHRARPLTLQDVDSVLDVIFAAHLHHNRFVVSTVPLEARLASAWNVSAQMHGDPEENTAVDSEGSVEMHMAALWKAVLHCPIETQANFFDLGGDSLVGAELIRSINAHFGVSLSMVDLFESASVASLSQQVENRRKPNQV
ncbi:3-oxoacyl-(acyl-carrier-protein) synthase/acyl carrier protein [Pseudomonas frederiksbergensis]|uniref:beta-ketoacyl synthase N-terminal-like domain-containing protein n=1 Tax=Pseudomonas frederiksbergensis TaxID=104087 RepID=UPI003D1AEA10